MVRIIRRGYFGVFAMLAAMTLLCVLAGISTAAAGDTTLASVDSSGKQANPGFSSEGDISADGRYVAFISTASNLDPDREGTTPYRDVFVHDRQTGTTERISVSDDGTAANADSFSPSISADGRYVAFVSEASNLVPDDTNDNDPSDLRDGRDVFVRDRQAGTTTRASVDSDGVQANGESDWATDVSSNGRVAFPSMASNLVPNDTNNFWDFFVHDLNTGTTERVNVDNDGKQVNGGVTLDISISANGRYVGFNTSAPYLVPDDPGDVWDGFVRDLDPAEGQTQKIWRVAYSASGAPRTSDDGRVVFTSYAPNLVPNDTNGVDDIFVRDLPAGSIQRVSVDSSENQANRRSFARPSISSDGCSVAFYSDATNLVPGDTNDIDPNNPNDGRDVFVRDLRAQTTERVSVDSSGNQGNGNSFGPSISADGRYVAFNSGASNLVPNDANNGGDVFVHERQADTTQPKDCTAPSTTASGTTSSGAPYTPGTWTNKDVKVTLSAQDNDGGSGVDKITYSASGAQTIVKTDAPGSSIEIPLSQEGTTTLTYYATDKAGTVEGQKTLTVRIDKTAPTGSVSINDGARRTRSRSVNLTLSATDPPPGSGVSQMRISNTQSGLSSATWEAYSTPKAWTLSSGTGTKTVYVQYRDGAGNKSTVVTDTIRYAR